MPNKLINALKKKRVIAGMKSISDVEYGIGKGIRVFFFLKGTIFDLKVAADLTRKHDALLFAHVDLIEGVANDAAGIEFIAREIGVDGILTTRSYLIKAARGAGIMAVQRLFILDSEALRTGLNIVRASKPDAVEILPALVLPKIVHRLPVEALPPIIAGGLVETGDEIEWILKTPALAVSTSKKELWGNNY